MPEGKVVRRRAMLPHRVTEHREWSVLQSRLRDRAAQISRQHIATAALCEPRIARGVYEDFSSTPANRGTARITRWASASGGSG